MEPGIWAGGAAGGAGRGVGERPAVASGFAAGPWIEVAVGVRGGADRLAVEDKCWKQPVLRLFVPMRAAG